MRSRNAEVGCGILLLLVRYGVRALVWGFCLNRLSSIEVGALEREVNALYSIWF